MKKFIAGKYVQQREYKSFTPSLINCPFAWENPQINILLERARGLLGELNAYTDFIPDVDFFIKMSVLKEATDSNRIEGTKTELDDVVLPQEEIDPDKRNDWEEVRNYRKAMNFAIDKLSELPLSMRLLRDTHKILLAGVHNKHKAPGEIRRSQNWIGGSSLSDAFFVPPSAEEVSNLLSDLEKFWHNQSLQIPELVRVAITHYQFETIHPFLDGNGRSGRLLIILQLINAKILKKPVFYMSTFFRKHRESYYDSLSMVRRSNNLDQWITFFLNGVADTAQHGLKTSKAIIALGREYEEKILTLGVRAENARKLLRFMYSEPIANANWAAEELNINYPTANRLLKSLTELGVIREITGFSRNRFFILEKYLDLFRN
ncbi:MAG: Fic family protein [Candidatus Poribacteria bacterium]|nr:Fic family protein [Candidatus Poribacteria bacterium]